MGSRRSISKIGQAYCFEFQRRRFSSKPSYPSSAKAHPQVASDDDDAAVPTAGISRPLSEILKDLNKKVPDSLIKSRTEASDFSLRYVPWHILNRILNLHAPEWSGEVRSITYSADATSVSVVYRVTLYGTDAEIFREATGSASVSDTSYGGPVQKAEAMAFRRACARLGLGLHLYHQELE
ncbi:DNA repair RAD52-like protein 1, mitochondrial isoform X2 [Salvia miltiorrhiza]|uniref:DNA repair RAD52-like protein 1, mitochondrial isoform X2 n=1 Tax=Salvia miltiorrhiza TaxID=226208 RepID=UPI0025AB8591|nr:DNA repair RAD52-like protein 1, mitochondrial isoform X2 [Salvia miltiorrhiza]